MQFPHGCINVRHLSPLRCLSQLVAAEAPFLSHKTINIEIKYFSPSTLLRNRDR